MDGDLKACESGQIGAGLKHKGNIFFYSIMAFSIAAVLTACTAQKGETGRDRGQDFTDQEETFSLESAEGKENEPLEEVFMPEVSDRETEVIYAGEEFTKSVFSAGGGMLYVYGIKEDGTFFLGGMETEEDTFREISVSMPADMRAVNMFVDEEGNCHTFWLKVEESEIGGQKLRLKNYLELSGAILYTFLHISFKLSACDAGCIITGKEGTCVNTN